MAAKQEITVKKDALPDFMRGQAGLGTEALGAGDVEIPRVKLMQAISPELEEYNDLKAGCFFHSLAELNLGPKVRITPIYIDQRYILWRPRKSGGGILARADDGTHWTPPGVSFEVRLDNGKNVTWRTAATVAQSGLDRWGSSDPGDPNSQPAATRMYNMVVTFADDPEIPPAVVTLQRAAVRVARRFIGKMKISRAPSFGLVFTMQSVKDTGPGGDFFNYAFKSDGMVESKENYDQNFEYYKYFKAQGIQVKDLEGAQEDQIQDTETAASESPKF